MSEIEIRSYSLYLFDLDSTLTESISGKTFPQTIEDSKWMPRRLEKLAELVRNGKRTAIITNQGGAAWGFVDPNEMTLYLTDLAKTVGIDAVFVCYRDTGEKARNSERTVKALTVPEYYQDWDRRKPGPGMLIEAMDFFQIDRHNTIMIGDREEDRQAAENAGVSYSWAWDYFGDGPIIV